jgi:hypothetical protein
MAVPRGLGANFRKVPEAVPGSPASDGTAKKPQAHITSAAALYNSTRKFPFAIEVYIYSLRVKKTSIPKK